MSHHELETRACQLIEKRAEELLESLRQHVAIPTGAQYRPGLDQYRDLWIQSLRELDAEVQTIESRDRPDWLTLPGATAGDDPGPMVLAERRVDAAGPRVMLCGHLDTVHDPSSSFRELSVIESGTIATGPGAVDMKGGLIVALTALQTLHQLDVPLNWSFLLNADEETGSFRSLHELQRVASDHDVGLIFEPALADGGLAVERMGSAQFKIEVFGRSAHVGREFTRGISAVSTLALLIQVVAALADPAAGKIVCVGPLQGGQVTNAVPDYAACWGNIRFRDQQAYEEVLGSLQELQTRGEDELPRVVVHAACNRPAKPLTPPVTQLADAARSVAEDLGQTLPFSVTGGVCDGNVLQEVGLPTLDTFGVRGGNLHREDEFVEIASLVERSQLMAVLLLRLANGTIAVPRRADPAR